jgi:hypothetical protein
VITRIPFFSATSFSILAPKLFSDPGRKQICAPEAEEGSDDDSGDSADESDEYAGYLYSSAMLGVRNRPNAMHQVWAATSPCASCATFAKFLQCS